MNQFGCKGTEKFAYMQEGSEILHKKKRTFRCAISVDYLRFYTVSGSRSYRRFGQVTVY